ncbi:glycoside hydrolase family 57 protein [Rhodococcus sp. X156]|uniref:1,4-alpha-glucan branching protein domain-containing protein n=1 Tax=Rhodococcus sp. X156 TaxID=2499145 RepID=UPI000FD919A5|nr:glycoside hydrolase family 57 protein [Rhodococcus sp. X156]
MSTEPVGTFCLVLHSHLPWLAHHGRWPVGEEWLYQSWAGSYQPLFAMLRRLADEGRTRQLTLGVTPVLAAQLDDAHSLRGMHDWLGDWQLRAHSAAGRRGEDALQRLATHEHRAAEAALGDFETHWRHGGSPQVRSVVDSGVVELLGGPLTHPFQPLMDPRLRDFALRSGLADATARTGRTPAGIWAPECAYAPGMETGYAAAGVRHFLVDGPALHGATSTARTVGDSDVVCFGRDLEVSYKVWSPRSGYPGHAAYRDFHTYDHPSGLKPARVTGRGVAPEAKAPYDPARAAAAVQQHAAEFVEVVRSRLASLAERDGRPGLVVAAYDTELFGHWWHEGPAWVEAVLRLLPEAGVRVTTLEGAVEAGCVGAPVDLPASSWGSGKDWRVWASDEVSDFVRLNADVTRTALSTVDDLVKEQGRNPVADQILREALLALSSDWAFMVTKDSAPDYARTRAQTHAHAVHEIAGAVRAGGPALALAEQWRRADGPFAALDARRLATPGSTASA